MPGGLLLIGVRHPQHRGLVKWFAGDLQPDRQPSRRETARDRDGWRSVRLNGRISRRMASRVDIWRSPTRTCVSVDEEPPASSLVSRARPPGARAVRLSAQQGS